MRKPCVAVLLVLLGVTGGAAAQPTVYFSNYTGHQVMSVDATAGGAPAVVFSGSQIGSRSFSPEDMVVGPDGNLYISDSPNGLIWRFDPTLPVTTGASRNPLVVVTFPGGVYPDGLAFSGNDDLYVNTRGSGSQPTGGRRAQGVWVVYDIAAPGVMPPYTPVQIVPSFSNSGAGLTFDEFGNLLFADNAGSRVLSARWNGPGSTPKFGPTFSSLVTTNITAPVGIAVNTCGDLLVASGTRIERFSITKDLSTATFTARFENTYIDFGGGDYVMHIERDAANNVYAATTGNNGGKVYKVTPILDVPNDPIRSCVTGSAGPAPAVVLKDFFSGSQAQAIGIAITPTDYPTSTTPSNTAIYAKSFDQLHTSNTYDFGHYRFTVAYKQVYNPFTQAFTALMSRPSDVTFDNAGFLPGTFGIRFPSLGGFVIQLLTASVPAGCASFAECYVPVAGTDFAATDQNGAAFTLTLEFRDPVNGFRNPGLAHSSIDTRTGIYTGNITADFWVLLDQAARGSGAIWGSKYVPFDEPLLAGLQQPLGVTLNEPALSGNPQFNIGQNFTISIVVRDAYGNTVSGLVLRVSAARIDPLPLNLETVRATNGAGNVMNENGNGKYSIGFDSNFLTGGTGTYQFTIFGNGFPPYVFYARFQQTVK